MAKHIFLFFLQFFGFLSIGFGQSALLTSDSLEHIAQVMVNDSILENRLAASDQLKSALLEIFNEPKSTRRSFDALQSIAVRNSKDDVFRLFSWQLYISPDSYKHECILQFMDGIKSPIVLSDESENIQYPDRKELGVNDWFGALYYNIIPFRLKGKTKYLLFGFDGATSTENCKIVDVLSIDKKGNLKFGSPIFSTNQNGIEKQSYRLFHQYDQNAKAVLNYDPEQEIIIFDHLIPWSSKEIGVGMTYVPDGSYQGFKLKKGKWRHIDKIYSHVSAVPVSSTNPFGTKQKPLKEH